MSGKETLRFISLSRYYQHAVYISKTARENKMKINLLPCLFPGGLDGKESACNAGDPGSVPGARRSAGEGIDYPLQYSWA